MVFLDDVLVYSRDMQQHEHHLRQVLTKLREHKLYAKASKCQFAAKEIEFLGQRVTPQGMSPTEEKLRAVREWQRPGDVKDVRSFLGFANFYRRYVYKFAEIAAPLTQLTKKDDPRVWGPLQWKSFQELKDALCAAPLLIFPDPALPYIVVTDASGVAVGGTLMQNQGEGLRPIAFMSRTLTPAERRYSPYERELAAIAFCFVKWRHYLEGCPGGVTVITDHKTLTPLMTQEVLSRVQTRWIRLGFFQSINPKIQYTPGKANVVADALSRSRGHGPGQWSTSQKSVQQKSDQNPTESNAVYQSSSVHPPVQVTRPVQPLNSVQSSPIFSPAQTSFQHPSSAQGGSEERDKAVEVQQDELIAALTRSSLVQTEELDLWRKAQNEDPVLRDIIQRVRVHREREIFQLTSHGLLIRKD